MLVMKLLHGIILGVTSLVIVIVADAYAVRLERVKECVSTRTVCVSVAPSDVDTVRVSLKVDESE